MMDPATCTAGREPQCAEEQQSHSPVRVHLWQLLCRAGALHEAQQGMAGHSGWLQGLWWMKITVGVMS